MSGYKKRRLNSIFNETGDVSFDATIGVCGTLQNDDEGYDPYNHTPAWMTLMQLPGTVSIDRVTFSVFDGD